jgi:hypothetical protein
VRLFELIGHAAELLDERDFVGLPLELVDAWPMHVRVSGVGGALRLGHEYDLLLVSLTPELMGTLHDFSGPSDPLVFSGMGGGRLTLGKVIEPGVFAHVGVGHASMPLDSRTGLAFDLGATVDLTLIPAVDLGVQGAYDLVAWQRESFDRFRAGAHVVYAP